jgi:O-antigen/teichoic acid export membrane protein
MPKASSLDRLGDNNWTIDLYNKSSSYISFIILPVCVSFIMFGGDFIALWVGEQFRSVSHNILIILSTSYYFYLVQSGIAYPMLMGTSNLKFPAWLMMATAILNLSLSIWLGKIFGIYGVAWGTAISNAVNTIGIISFTSKKFNIRMFRYIVSRQIIPLTSGLFFVFPSMILRNYYVPNSFQALFLMIFACCVTYGFAVFHIYLDQDAKHYILRIFNIRTLK